MCASKKYFLGIDVSTTGSKALLIDESRPGGGVTSSPHTLQTPHPLWSEQDPLEWWQASAPQHPQGIEEAGVDGESVAAVGMTGQMHGLVLLDGAGRCCDRPSCGTTSAPRRNAMRSMPRVGQGEIHPDHRQCCPDRLHGARRSCGCSRMSRRFMRQVRHVLLPKDYVRYRLTGEYAMDKADGAGTVLFDLKARTWSPEVLAAWGSSCRGCLRPMKARSLPGRSRRKRRRDRVEGRHACGSRRRRPGGPGSGGRRGGAGHGGADGRYSRSGVCHHTSAPYIEPEGRLHAFCHAVPGMWHFMGVMLSAAGSLQWYRDTLAPGMSFDDLLQRGRDRPLRKRRAAVPAIPFSGERTPYPDPLARAPGWVSPCATGGPPDHGPCWKAFPLG